ncbi:hypothetical protein B296_00017033 [Ensete ventricosum]|uniref:Uncharacterized protein n=1 Tax=Ensete ventricosum TaxID=4639 RepID=A0A427AWA4_ENSVE|nr:hypothetical protein B296_00017033 [Ensete ventricosum]
MPSPVDAKSLRDLEVMKSCHDVTWVVIEESFGLIRERYSIPEEYVLRASLPDARPEKWVKVVVKKHKSCRGEGSSHTTTQRKEPVASTEEDSLPTYRWLKSMKNLCGTRVRKDDEGYYALQITNSTPKDSDYAMRARWPNLTYSEKLPSSIRVREGSPAPEPSKGALHLAF